eukprot:UN31583
MDAYLQHKKPELGPSQRLGIVLVLCISSIVSAVHVPINLPGDIEVPGVCLTYFTSDSGKPVKKQLILIAFSLAPPDVQQNLARSSRGNTATSDSVDTLGEEDETDSRNNSTTGEHDIPDLVNSGSHKVFCRQGTRERSVGRETLTLSPITKRMKQRNQDSYSAHSSENLRPPPSPVAQRGKKRKMPQKSLLRNEPRPTKECQEKY